MDHYMEELFDEFIRDFSVFEEETANKLAFQECMMQRELVEIKKTKVDLDKIVKRIRAIEKYIVGEIGIEKEFSGKG